MGSGHRRRAARTSCATSSGAACGARILEMNLAMSEAPQSALPAGLLLAYYGDDFTGSTDATEALTAAGVPTLLCLDTPTPEWLARFPDVRCIGLAGSSRGRSPA